MVPDVFSKEKRSEVMRRVRSYDTKWEMDFRRELWRRGLRYRVHFGPRKIDAGQPFQRYD